MTPESPLGGISLRANTLPHSPIARASSADNPTHSIVARRSFSPPRLTRYRFRSPPGSFRGSFLAPIFLAHFLRVRYLTSPFTRSTVSGASSALDRWVARPGRPPVVRQGWELVKRLVSGWMGGVGAAAGAPQAQAQGPAAANAQAARR